MGSLTLPMGSRSSGIRSHRTARPAGWPTTSSSPTGSSSLQTTLRVVRRPADRLRHRGDGGLTHRRVWADGGPDGICLDAEGTVWTHSADTRTHTGRDDAPEGECVRVREGGEIVERIRLDRAGFACMLGGLDGCMLFMTAADWRGTDHVDEAVAGRTGQVLMTAAPAPGASVAGLLPLAGLTSAPPWRTSLGTKGGGRSLSARKGPSSGCDGPPTTIARGSTRSGTGPATPEHDHAGTGRRSDASTPGSSLATDRGPRPNSRRAGQQAGPGARGRRARPVGAPRRRAGRAARVRRTRGTRLGRGRSG
jgi:hypothetical protein